MPKPTNLQPAAVAESAALATDGAADKPTGKLGERAPPREIHGPAGPEPTRYGDWERHGRCIDF